MNDLLSRVKNYLPTWRPFHIPEKLDPPDKSGKKRMSYQIKTHRKNNYDIEQDDLKMAIDLATDEYDPRREKLQEVYREAKRDLKLLAQMTNGIDDVLQQGNGMFDKRTDELHDEATRLIKKQWFEQLLTIRLMEEFDGFKLAEIGKLIETEMGWEIRSFHTFPEEHVLPERGLLIANPTAQNGLPFRPEDCADDPQKLKLAEAVSEWLIECGSPKNLGLLAVATKNCIYKKYALGDWGRSSEKWMDPTTIIKSGTDSETENDKKANAAENLGNNNYMILDESDDVELLERRNVSAYSITKEFLEFLDKENAMGINGQFATSDEKAFVGSSEVQERTQLKRTRRRSRTIAYWLNETVIPKLMTLNGGDNAYKIFEGLEFRWLEMKEEEDGESTDPHQSDDPKKKQRGGAGAKKLQGSNNLPTTRSRLSTELHQLYGSLSSPRGACNGGARGAEGVPLLENSAKLETLATKMVDRIYQRKIRPGMIDGDLTQAQADELMAALTDGYAETLTNPAFASLEHRIRVQLQYNVHVMAAFKNHQNVLDIHALLFNDDGSIKTKRQFVKDVKAINKDYNKHYAAAEYRHAKGQAQMADKYLLYKDRGGSFVYVSQNDGRVRPEHKELHGLTAPVDHLIWDSVLPKNAWGCRCFYRWIKDVVTKINEQAQAYADNLPAFFKNNPGKTGKVFNEHHPYFEIGAQWLARAEKLFGFRPPVDLDRFNANLAIYETLKDNADYTLRKSFTDTGGFVFVHKRHDVRDLTRNVKAADKLASKGYAVEIREHVHRDFLPNPELGLNGVVTDLKSPGKVGGIKSAFNTARKQGIDTVVIEVNGRWSVAQIRAKLDDGFHFNEPIVKAILVYKGEVIEITRDNWQDGQLWKVL